MNSNPFPAPIQLNGRQVLAGSCSEKIFVHVFSGNVVEQYTVANVPTVGLPLEFSLWYNSQETVSGPVGNKWSHNLMMNLVFTTGAYPLYATYTSKSGTQFNFSQASSGAPWYLDQGLSEPSAYSYFVPAALTSSGTNWLLTFWPTGKTYLFNSTGQLLQMADISGNTHTLAYSGSQLTSITEPTGRQILFSYNAAGLLSQVEDPNGNTTSLLFDSSNNLTNIVGPAGCVMSYGYSTPSNNLLTSRTDPMSQTYHITYDSSTRLYTISDPDSNTLTYTYFNNANPSGLAAPCENEYISDIYTDTSNFSMTVLVDARAKQWRFMFDSSANLWRVIDPLNHWYHYIWDDNQQLLVEMTGFSAISTTISSTPLAGPRDNPYNRFRKNNTDDFGNLTCAIDSTGLVTHYTYDQNTQRLTSVYPGRAHFGIQGDWPAHFGKDGYVLCAFNLDVASSTISDRVSYPSYLNATTPLTFDANSHLTGHPYYWTTNASFDPRAVSSPTSLLRQNGYWKQDLAANLVFYVNLNASKSFNLSLYVSAVDQGVYYSDPLTYFEQSGHDITLTVQDQTYPLGQSFRIVNAAAGCWVTFPVTGDATHPITVTVSYNDSYAYALVSAIAFDPYYNRQTIYTYDPTSGLLTSTLDGQGNQTSMTYNTDGTMATFTDARLHTSHFYYADAHKNLTSIVDANSGTTAMVYDLNGNVLQVTDPNSIVTQRLYDSKNRVIEVIDGKGEASYISYRPDGTVQQLRDAADNVTSFTYTSEARLASVTDPQGNLTQIMVDPIVKTVNEVFLVSFGRGSCLKNSKDSSFDQQAFGRILVHLA